MTLSPCLSVWNRCPSSYVMLPTSHPTTSSSASRLSASLWRPVSMAVGHLTRGNWGVAMNIQGTGRKSQVICAHGCGNVTWIWLHSGCKSQEKRGKSHKYDSKGNRFKKKSKEGSMLRRPRTSSQHAARGGHSDDDEDEGVPASYHTVSLQVSQDVSMAPFTSSSLPAPDCGCGPARDSQDAGKGPGPPPPPPHFACL